MNPYLSNHPVSSNLPGVEDYLWGKNASGQLSLKGRDQSGALSPPPPPPPTASAAARAIDVAGSSPPSGHLCGKFVFPPPPPANSKRIGPRRKFEFFFF
jgi:hypothetical protein